MLVVLPPIFAADTKLIYGYNLVAPLKTVPSINNSIKIRKNSVLEKQQ